MLKLITAKKRLALVMLLALTACTSIEDRGVFETESAAVIESLTSASVLGTSAVSETTTEAAPPADIEITICAAGDNLIHSPIYNQARRGDEYDFTEAYENIADLISEAGVAFINQETLICNDIYEPSNYPRFNSPNALGDHMIEIGFDVFAIANNHTLDMGTQGLTACLDYWSAKDVVAVGAYYDSADRANIRTNEIDGVVFSYLAYTEHLNGLSLPSDSPLEIGDANDIDTMTAEIIKAKEISDVCVVFLHWGAEGSDIIEDYQRETARTLAEAGADIIIGTHPHVLRDIEIIGRSDGTDAICAYSLGNFISAQNIPQTMIGGILTFTVKIDGETRKPDINGAELIPTVTHYEQGYRNVKIYKLSDYNENLAAAHGVKAHGRFDMDYIAEILRKTTSVR